MLQAALQLADLGYAVFALHPGEKIPLAGSNGVKDATTDPAKIEAAWHATPEANIGLSTDGLLVVDVDGADNPWPTDAEQAADLLKAPCSLTANGGRHYIFRQPPGEPLRNTAGRLAEHVDTRAGGGYIVVPPSKLANGGQYRWAPSMALDCPRDQLPLPPAWLLAALATPKQPAIAAGDSTAKIPEGGRNDAIHKLGSKLRGQGFAEGEILALAQAFNVNRCQPPLDRAEVERTIKSASVYQANAGGLVESIIGESTDAGAAVLVCLDDVQPESVEWLWPSRVAIGKVSLLYGDPGLGKSFLSFDISARVSAGTCWPDTPVANPAGGVILLSAEDDLADTIRPRLDAAGANTKNIFALQGVAYDLDKKELRAFSLDGDLPALKAAIKGMPNCRLVVIDPISIYMGKTDSHKNTDVRNILGPLKQLAEEHRVAVLAISHLNKAAGQSALYRATGSLAFVAAARAAWLVAKDKDDDSRRLFLSVKNNLAQEPSGLAFRILNGRVEWEAGEINMRADDLVGEPAKGEKKSKLHEAADWIREQLKDGPRRARDMEQAAEECGIGPSLLKRAKAHADIQVEREGGAAGTGYWVWYMPGATLITKLAKGDHSTPDPLTLAT